MSKNSATNDGAITDVSEKNEILPEKQDLQVAERTIEDAKQFNENLLTALQTAEPSDHNAILDQFIDGAEDFVKHPVSFNKVIIFLLNEKLYLHKIEKIYRGRMKLGGVSKVYVPSGDDHVGFMSILNKMINYDHKDYSRYFMQFLMGGGRDVGFFVSIGPVNLQEAESFNKSMLTILEKDESYLTTINAYCRTFSRGLKVHEASYILLLNKISEMEGK